MKKIILCAALFASATLLQAQQSNNVALKKNLTSGYQEFFEHYFKQEPALYKKLAKGQYPETLFLACCDSRIDPAILTNAQPGELFVVRNIANFVPQHISRLLESEAMTAIELGVTSFPIKQVIVLGHQHCAGVGAVASSCHDAQTKKSTEVPLVWQEQCTRLNSAVQEKYSQATAEKFEKTNIKLACHDLLTYPFITKLVNQGKLTVRGWYFSLETGSIEVYDPYTQTFTPLV